MSIEVVSLPVERLEHFFTARDLFAAFALAGLVAAMSDKIKPDAYNPGPWAETAYEYADAMLKARATP
jgi:adenine-specific DNA methylase